MEWGSVGQFADDVCPSLPHITYEGIFVSLISPKNTTFLFCCFLMHSAKLLHVFIPPSLLKWETSDGGCFMLLLLS